MIILDTIRNAGNGVLVGTSMALANTGVSNDIVDLFTATVKGFSLPVSNSFLRDCMLFKSLSPLRRSVNDIKDLVTGEAAGMAPGQSNSDRIALGESIFIPNIIRVTSKICFLVSDVSGTLKWIEQMGLVKLTELANQIGAVPYFSFILHFEIDTVMGKFSIVGFALSIADNFRDLAQEGFNWKSTTKIAADIVSISFIICKIGKMEEFALIAQGVSGAIGICRFFAFP